MPVALIYCLGYNMLGHNERYLSMAKNDFQFIKLPVSFLREGKQYIAYTPALDLSTCGKTFKEAKKRFGEIVEIFFDELARNGTLEDVLVDLGWKKVQTEWIPPVVVSQEIQAIRVPA